MHGLVRLITKHKVPYSMWPTALPVLHVTQAVRHKIRGSKTVNQMAVVQVSCRPRPMCTITSDLMPLFVNAGVENGKSRAINSGY